MGTNPYRVTKSKTREIKGKAMWNLEFKDEFLGWKILEVFPTREAAVRERDTKNQRIRG